MTPPDAPALTVGALVELEVGPVAHGGHFVARLEQGADRRVVFVRHALPGEWVRVRLTEDDGRFLRGDAVAVLRGSPYRVEAPCPLARPDGCGGCDFQHVALPEQRRLKTEVLREQLRRLAGLDTGVAAAAEVEPVPDPVPAMPGLRWRTRMQYVQLPNGRQGLRKHRSHEVVEVEDCLIDAHLPRPAEVVEQVHGREFRVAGDGFWQVHPAAGEVLVDTVLDQLFPRAGESVLDLYAGSGLFAAFLADAVGSRGEVIAVEGDRQACDLAAHNLADRPWARVIRGRVDRVLARSAGLAPDLVVLDPPRAGAKRTVVGQVAALRPRAVCYVACDPAALARDIAYFEGHGYRLERLRAFDLFPMTHHMECVALLTKTDSDLR